MKAKPPHAQIVCVALWESCAFCRRFSSNRAILVRRSLVYVCGRCAAELVTVLQEVADEDERR